MNQVAAVEERGNHKPFRKRFLYTFQSFLYILYHRIGVGAFQHQNHTAYRFVPILGNGAVTHVVAEMDFLGHILYEDGNAVVVPDDDIPQVVQRACQPFATDEIGHVVPLDIRTAGVHIVFFEGFKDLGNGNFHGVEFFGVERNFVLFYAPAK